MHQLNIAGVIHVAQSDFGPSANLFLKFDATLNAHIDRVDIFQLLSSSSTEMMYEGQHIVMIAQGLCILFIKMHFSVHLKPNNSLVTMTGVRYVR